MKTVDYYKKAIARALNARESIERANADYTHSCELAKNAFDGGILGEQGYKQQIAELEHDRNCRIEGALRCVDEVAAEYSAEMQELGRLDGSKIDSGTIALLNSGLQLTNEDWQQLANTYKDNYVMTRILRERYNANRPKNDGNDFTLGKKSNGLTFVQFGQMPQDRAENFTKFTQLLHYNAASDTMPNEGRMAYAAKSDYWNHCAKDSISRMKPFEDENFDNLDAEFPVEYVQAKSVVW